MEVINFHHVRVFSILDEKTMVLPNQISNPLPGNDALFTHTAQQYADLFGAWERLDNGLYVAANSTADQPKYFKLTSNLDYDGLSYISPKVEMYKNNVDSPGAKDHMAEVRVVFRGSLRVFQPWEVSAALAVCQVPFRGTDIAMRTYRSER